MNIALLGGNWDKGSYAGRFALNINDAHSYANIPLPFCFPLSLMVSAESRTRGMSHTVRQSCAWHECENGLALVHGCRFSCRIRALLCGFPLHAILAVAALAMV